MNKAKSTIVFLLFLPLWAWAQSVVVVDEWTRQPITHASLYSKDSGKFRSAITDNHGRATVGFSFRRLTVSHLNYEKLVLNRLPDTIFMEPKFHLAAEVVVNSEPAWIRPLLRRFVKEKSRNYYSLPLALGYDYTTQSIAGNSFYRYRSDGWLRMRHPDANHYFVCQREGHITAADSTHLTDMASMRRMLYEDFVSELDNGFIRSHKFSVSDRYEADDENLVELIFRSRRHPDDRGSFVIDTVRCLVLSATRTMGIKTNKAERVSQVMLSFARAMSGYNITEWDVDYGVSYAQTEGCWHPQDIRYKFYFKAREAVTSKEQDEFDKETGGGFSNMEATLHLGAARDSIPSDVEWKQLPGSWYIKLNTDAERQQERELANMPATFTLLGNDE